MELTIWRSAVRREKRSVGARGRRRTASSLRKTGRGSACGTRERRRGAAKGRRRRRRQRSGCD
jgi:hypothetical protein